MNGRRSRLAATLDRFDRYDRKTVKKESLHVRLSHEDVEALDLVCAEYGLGTDQGPGFSRALRALVFTEADRIRRRRARSGQ